MSIDMNDRAAVEHKLWDDIERHQTGMLGLAEEPTLQPMTAFVERGGERLWFFSRTDSELARRIGQGREGMFVFQQRDLQATITGHMSVQHDAARIDKDWNAVVAAWHPQGKSDPRLTLICLDARDAEVWCSQAGPVTFAWEIAVANARKHEPHLGGRTNLHFH